MKLILLISSNDCDTNRNNELEENIITSRHYIFSALEFYSIKNHTYVYVKVLGSKMEQNMFQVNNHKKSDT